MLQLFDTATQEIKPLQPREPGTIGMYVCGPTVYGPPHVGHGRSVLTYDILRRYLEFRGLRVRHVSNITDIDDKIINRARLEGRSWQEVAREFEDDWWSTLDDMGVLHPVARPHATEFVEEMIVFIESLIGKGFAYETREGVYLRAGRVPGYGLLSHQSIEDRLAGARVEPDASKEDPIDFALWKRAKNDEPAWDSPWGMGRPGWHTECVVMSLAILGDDFELHGGGQDLIFPHHDNERAQALAGGYHFARHWMHNGLVTVEGEKMSKSLDNFTTLRELLEHTDARSYRLLVLRAHYRSPLEVTETTIEASAAALGRIDALARRVAGVARAEDDVSRDLVSALTGSFVAAMDNDLDTPGALAEIFDYVRRANTLADEGGAPQAKALSDTIAELLGALGVIIGPDDEVDDESEALVRERDAARKVRDFSTSDSIRARLEALGWTVEDTPEGTRIHR